MDVLLFIKYQECSQSWSGDGPRLWNERSGSYCRAVCCVRAALCMAIDVCIQALCSVIDGMRYVQDILEG